MFIFVVQSSYMRKTILILISVSIAFIGKAQTPNDHFTIKLGVNTGVTGAVSNKSTINIMEQILFSGGIQLSGEYRKPGAMLGFESGLGYHLYRSQNFRLFVIGAPVGGNIEPFTNISGLLQTRLHAINLPLFVNMYRGEWVFQGGIKLNYIANVTHVVLSGFLGSEPFSKAEIKSAYKTVNTSVFFSARQRLEVKSHVLEIGPAIEVFTVSAIKGQFYNAHPIHSSLNVTWQF
jgi:hypothetical protein